MFDANGSGRLAVRGIPISGLLLAYGTERLRGKVDSVKQPDRDSSVGNCRLPTSLSVTCVELDGVLLPGLGASGANLRLDRIRRSPEVDTVAEGGCGVNNRRTCYIIEIIHNTDR